MKDLSWRQLLIIAKEKYGLKEFEEISRPLYFSADCDYINGKITLNKDRNFEFIDKAFLLFHELGHIHCYINGIWKNYHFDLGNVLTTEKKNLVIKTGLKAERWIDNWAMNEVKKYVNIPEGCKGGYSSEKAANNYRKYHLSFFR